MRFLTSRSDLPQNEQERWTECSFLLCLRHESPWVGEFPWGAARQRWAAAGTTWLKRARRTSSVSTMGEATTLGPSA